MAKLRGEALPLWPSFVVSHLVCPPSPSIRGYPDGERIDFHPALQQLQDFNQTRVQLECKLGQEAQELAWRYNNCRIKLSRKHKRKQAEMMQEANATFQEVFSMVSLTDSIKLLPWCVSSAVPFHYMSEVLATAMQQNKNIPTTTTIPKPQGSPALGPSSSPAHPTGILPPLVPLLLDIPFVGIPQGEPISLVHSWSHPEIAGLLLQQFTLWSLWQEDPEVGVRTEQSSAWGDKNMPKLVLGVWSSIEQWEQEPVSPPSVQLGSPLIQKLELWQEAERVPGIRPHQTQSHQGRIWMTLIWTQSPETASHAQTQMRWPYKLPTRSTGRGSGLPVDWGRVVSQLRFNWKGSATVTRTCWDMTIRVLEQSRIALLWKTTTHLRCKKWWSGLTNWPLAPKVTPETQRLKPMAGQRLWYCHWNKAMHTITDSRKGEWLEPW